MSTPPLELYVLSPHWGLPSMSPFGIKLASWMRVAGVPHVLRFEDDPRKGPKGKSPWIVEDGRPMGDSGLIIAHLSSTRSIDLERGLSQRDRDLGLLLRRTFEEHFHQVVEYTLFVLDEGWEASRVHFDFLPGLIRPILTRVIRNQILKASHVRGLGRHTPEEIGGLAVQDIRVAASILGDKPYLLCDRPTTVDCTVFGFLAVTLWAPIDWIPKQELQRHRNLVAYCERMREVWWPEPASEGAWWPAGAEPPLERTA